MPDWFSSRFYFNFFVVSTSKQKDFSKTFSSRQKKPYLARRRLKEEELLCLTLDQWKMALKVDLGGRSIELFWKLFLPFYIWWYFFVDRLHFLSKHNNSSLHQGDFIYFGYTDKEYKSNLVF